MVSVTPVGGFQESSNVRHGPMIAPQIKGVSANTFYVVNFGTCVMGIVMAHLSMWLLGREPRVVQVFWAIITCWVWGTLLTKVVLRSMVSKINQARSQDPNPYERHADEVQRTTGAQGVVVIVQGGQAGDGISILCLQPATAPLIADGCRFAAQCIEEQHEAYSQRQQSPTLQ